MPADCSVLPWDSEFFGAKIARLAPGRLTTDSLAAALRWCESEHIECLYFLAESDHPETVRLAEAVRFQLVDIRVRLAREATPATPRVAGTSVRLFLERDAEALRAIARAGHRDSRFFADPRFGAGRAERLFETWIERSYRDPACAVFVAEVESAASGYCACHVERGEGVIGLLAVAPSARGRGVGQDLVASAIAHFRKQGIGRIAVVTQGRNIQGQRLYQKCGFRTDSLMLWYHKWF